MDQHLKQLKLKNFMSYKEAEIEFKPGINVITGLFDSGKSNIFRAIELLRKNRPTGRRFKHNRDDSLTAEVCAKFADNTSVTFRKNKKSTYKAIVGEERKSFESGVDVPDFIKEAIRIDDINLHEQHGSPFLLWMTGGEIAKMLNRISNMEDYGDWLLKLSSLELGYSGMVKKSREAIESLKEEAKKYEGFFDSEKHIVDAEKMEKRIEKLSDELEVLLKGLDVLEESEQDRKNSQLMGRIQEIIQTLEENEALLEEREGIRAWMEFGYEALNLAEMAEKAQALLQEAEEGEAEIIKLQAEADTINLLKTAVKAEELAYKELSKAIDQYCKGLEDLGMCDQCFSEISPKTIKEIKVRLCTE